MTMSVTTSIVWHDPNETPPPFQAPVLVALGSWRDECRGFKAHTEIRVVRIRCMNSNGSRKEGKIMAAELAAGTSKWDDLQFTLLDDAGEEISDTLSDSIMWWAERPTLPERRG